MVSETTKILLVGIFGAAFLLGIYFLLSIYANSVIEARTTSMMLMEIRLSGLSNGEKQQILNGAYKHISRLQRRVDISFGKTLAGSPTTETVEQCAVMMMRFTEEAEVCISSTETNAIQTILSSCPAVDELSQKIKSSCSIDTAWR